MSSVTALLPAWQAADFIQPTLDSLSAQTHPDLKVIVSVDACTDQTAAICERHALRDPRFTVVRQPQRLGYTGNSNALFDMASGEYVLFAFHDDLIRADYVARLAALLDAHPEVVLSFSDVLLTHVDGRKEHWVMNELEGLSDRVARGKRMLAGNIKWWLPVRGLFRLAQARRIGGLKLHAAGEFATHLPWLFHMSLLGEFARVPEVLYRKHYKPGSLSRTWDFSSRQRFEVGTACMTELWNSALSTEEKLALAGPIMGALLSKRATLEKADAC